MEILKKKKKKAFLNDQCKKKEEKNKMGKTRDLFKKIRDTKGTFHAKRGTIKGQKLSGSNWRRSFLFFFFKVARIHRTIQKRS